MKNFEFSRQNFFDFNFFQILTSDSWSAWNLEQESCITRLIMWSSKKLKFGAKFFLKNSPSGNWRDFQKISNCRFPRIAYWVFVPKKFLKKVFPGFPHMASNRSPGVFIRVHGVHNPNALSKKLVLFTYKLQLKLLT